MFETMLSHYRLKTLKIIGYKYQLLYGISICELVLVVFGRACNLVNMRGVDTKIL
jgi:hypothetical protein